MCYPTLIDEDNERHFCDGVILVFFVSRTEILLNKYISHKDRLLLLILG